MISLSLLLVSCNSLSLKKEARSIKLNNCKLLARRASGCFVEAHSQKKFKADFYRSSRLPPGLLSFICWLKAREKSRAATTSASFARTGENYGVVSVQEKKTVAALAQAIRSAAEIIEERSREIKQVYLFVC